MTQSVSKLIIMIIVVKMFYENDLIFSSTHMIANMITTANMALPWHRGAGNVWTTWSFLKELSVAMQDMYDTRSYNFTPHAMHNQQNDNGYKR